MSVLNENQLLGAPPASTSQYQIQRSLRFNSADSAYLSRTPAAAGNTKTWTWSGWVKKCSATDQALISSGSYEIFGFQSNGTLRYEASSPTFNHVTTAVFRDSSAWMHVVLSVDTTQTTASNRVSIYVNNTLQALSTATYPSLDVNTLINGTGTQHIGVYNAAGSRYLDSYLADVHFIDGQALTPSSFGQTDATTGQWIPKAYTGTYGTNGFKLNFSNNSAATATTLGADSSGNGNNWTPTNLSVTAGAGNDSLVDTPTSYGTDTGVGGEVRGNYCTLNPLTGLLTLVNGNLEASTPPTTAQHYPGRGSIYVNSGKWYWEIQSPTVTSSVPMRIGIAGPEVPANTDFGNYTQGYSYLNNGNKQNNSTGAAYGASYSNDIIGVALDLDAGTLVFYKNGVSQGTAYTGISGSFAPAISVFGNQTSGSTICNFGQRQWAYAPPAGFKALCDTNLPAPTIVKPSTVMDVILRNGFGASGGTVTGLNFSPDLIWEKPRSIVGNHYLTDSVRGTASQLYSNLTNAEGTLSTYVTAFNSNGYSMGSSDWATNNTVAAWCWDAGSSTVTNTAGTITSQVRANASAGFSIVTYTGTGANATVGHGLGVAPQFLIVKQRTGTGAPDWGAWHTSLGGGDKFLYLSLTSSVQTGTTPFNGTVPTSSVLSVGTWAGSNQSSATYVAYCFAPVAGYSSFGSYTGNGSADGPFVYTGFRPRYLMVKRTTAATTGEWWIWDSSRIPYNYTAGTLSAQSSAIENGGGDCDFLSNGFKPRNSNTNDNGSADTYIYAAFAEFPFQYARAR